MGMLVVETMGSFRPRDRKSFSAVKHGHAQAVAEAIEWLSKELLPEAIAMDHELQAQGHHPDSGGFRRMPAPIPAK